MKKKHIALIISAIIVPALLAGCGGESSPSNINPPSSYAPSTSGNISTNPGETAPPPATPSTFSGSREQEAELGDGVTAALYTETFEDGPTFSIYVAEGYEGRAEGDLVYIRAQDKPDDAYIEIKYIANSDADRLAPSVLDNYDNISNLTDHDTIDSGGFTFRFVEGEGKEANWKAYLLTGQHGVLQLVVKESTNAPDGAGEALDGMVRSFSPD